MNLCPRITNQTMIDHIIEIRSITPKEIISTLSTFYLQKDPAEEEIQATEKKVKDTTTGTGVETTRNSKTIEIERTGMT